MGMENVLMSMMLCPDALEQFFDRICDYFCHLLDIALEYDVDGVYFGDDWGQQRGLIIAPTHALTPDIPPENVLAMWDVFTHQKQYL